MFYACFTRAFLPVLFKRAYACAADEVDLRGGEWGPRHRAGLVLPEREAPRERGAGLNLTTYKVYKEL